MSGRVRRTKKLVRDLAATKALTREQRAAILAAATAIPVIEDGTR